MNKPLIISLSPRPGGNSDQGAACFARALNGPSQEVKLRNFQIAPCSGCAACARTGHCIHQDGAGDLFTLLDQAPGLVLAAPVYFYHLPAQAKAWIDRAQARYLARQAGKSKPAPLRSAYLILVAGRICGDNLFAGIIPTLRYFLDVFDFQITGQALLRGLDRVEDFAHSQNAAAQIRDMAKASAW